MKTNKRIQSIIKKMMDSVYHIDAMTPEFKAANAELLKAIKMNDKSGAIPHADLEAVNKAMKANDAEKVGAALKKVQLQFSKAEKKLDDEVKDVTARLAGAKNAVEKSKADLKASKADAALFDKARKAADGIKANPRNAPKLSPVADKLKKYGDLSKRVSQIVTLASSNKDVSKQVDMLKKAIDTAEKKYKKEAANVEKEAKKAKDELDVLNMRVKVTQGKKDAFQKERLYLANAVKQIPEGDLRQERKEKKSSVHEKAVQIVKQKLEPALKKMSKEAKEKADDYKNKHKEAISSVNDIKAAAETFKSKAKELLQFLDNSGTSNTKGTKTLKTRLLSTLKSFEHAGALKRIAAFGDKYLESDFAGDAGLKLNKEQFLKYRSLKDNLFYSLTGIQEAVKKCKDPEALNFVSDNNKLGKKAGYLQTNEGQMFYEESLENIGNIIHEIVKLFQKFDFGKVPDRGVFKFSYFDNPNPLIKGVLAAIESSK